MTANNESGLPIIDAGARVPVVSVVMTVKNGQERILESIQSLLNQTFSDFELIIIDDGSNDKTLEIIKSFCDPRIKVFSQPNQGVAISANRGLSIAKGRYIARQDHDDISRPRRLEEQVLFLDANPDIYLVGTAAEIFNPHGATGRFHDHPVESDVLALELIFDNPFVHSSIMFRREVLEQVGIYSNEKEIALVHDYDFISRVSAKFRVANLPERLVEYFESESSLSSGLRNVGSNEDLIFRKQKAEVMARNISSRINQPEMSTLINFLAKIYTQIPVDFDQNIQLKDVQFLIAKVFDESTMSKKNDLYLKRSNHLKHCWFINKGSPKTLSWVRYRLNNIYINWLNALV